MATNVGVDEETGETKVAQLNPNWAAYYQAAMEEAPAMVFCLTQAWCESQWCEEELFWSGLLFATGGSLIRANSRKRNQTSITNESFLLMNCSRPLNAD